MTPQFIIFAMVFFIGIILRTTYELLKKAGKLNPKSIIVFIIMLFLMVSMWMSWFGLCPLDPLRINLPKIIHWIGYVIFLIGLILAIVSFIQLRGVENINHLVKTGLFYKIRHPMYIGFILWILGWSIYYGAVISLVIGFFGIANILFWRRIEEKNLISQFGKKYQEYAIATWF
jgi:protein-S-isoprenylcysteine O-methyltransferase Ste14